MTRRVLRVPAAVAAALVLGLAAAGCTTGAGSEQGGGGLLQVHVDVDTPALRHARDAAGIEPCPRTEGTGEVEDGLPDIVLPCLGGGRSVDLGDLRGPLVINLWAQWCEPCRKELPYYQQLHERADGKLRVIGVDYQDPQPDRALDLVADAGVTYPLLADPAGKLHGPLRVLGLPGIVFVDESGEVTDVRYLQIESYGQLRDLVREHLDVRL